MNKNINSNLNDYDGVDESTSLLNNEQHIKTNSQTTNTRTTTNTGISWYFAVFLIVNAALGAGLLNFAKAFDNAGGILAATLIHLVNIRLI